jgi:hypothetical protein
MWYLELPLIGWLALAALAYGLVTAVLYATAMWVRFQKQCHDRAIEARRRQFAKREAEEKESDVQFH